VAASCLLALLLLVQLLVTCPSPSGQGLLHLATFFSLQGFNPLIWFLGWCGGDVRTWLSPGCFGLAKWLCASPSAVNYLLLLVQLKSCGGDNTTLSQCD
jgi:hypothetical protein